MPKCFIGFGRCSKYFLFFLGTVTLKTINYFIFDNKINPDSEGGMFGFTPVLSNHLYVQYFFKYLSFIIGGSIFELISSKRSKSKKMNIVDDNNDNQEKNEKEILERNNSGSVLIFNDQIEKVKTKNFKDIIGCSSFSLSLEIANIFFLFGFSTIEIWTFEMIFTIYFLKRYFIIDFYNFKKLAIFIILVPTSILLITSSFLPTTNTGDETKDKNVYGTIKDLTGNYLYLIPIEIGFLISGAFFSFSRVKAKVLMDLRYLSPYWVIIIIGISGTLLTLIILIISSFFKCPDSFIDACKVEHHENKGIYYLDNALVYFYKLKDLGNQMYIEIFLIIPFLFVINFLQFTCEIWIIYHFNPFFILLRDNIYYLIYRLIFVIINHDDFEKYISLTQFIILELSEILSIIAFLIYLEIIELRFCGLDKSLKKNLVKKSEEEIRSSTSDKNNKLISSMSTENYDDYNVEVNLKN